MKRDPVTAVLIVIAAAIFASVIVLDIAVAVRADGRDVGYTMRVHKHPGQWAYTDPHDRRQILAPPHTDAAHTMRRAYPGTLYVYRGQTRGVFEVTAVIDITKKARAWDRVMHIKGTSFYVFLDRVTA